MVNDGPERSFFETLSGGKATTTRLWGYRRRTASIGP